MWLFWSKPQVTSIVDQICDSLLYPTHSIESQFGHSDRQHCGTVELQSNLNPSIVMTHLTILFSSLYLEDCDKGEIFSGCGTLFSLLGINSISLFELTACSSIFLAFWVELCDYWSTPPCLQSFSPLLATTSCGYWNSKMGYKPKVWELSGQKGPAQWEEGFVLRTEGPVGLGGRMKHVYFDKCLECATCKWYCHDLKYGAKYTGICFQPPLIPAGKWLPAMFLQGFLSKAPFPLQLPFLHLLT